MEIGAAIAWHDPQHGISAQLQGRSLLTHADQEFRQQGMAFSFAWEPNPTNRGPSLPHRHHLRSALVVDALLPLPAGAEPTVGTLHRGETAPILPSPTLHSLNLSFSLLFDAVPHAYHSSSLGCQQRSTGIVTPS